MEAVMTRVTTSQVWLDSAWTTSTILSHLLRQLLELPTHFAESWDSKALCCRNRVLHHLETPNSNGAHLEFERSGSLLL